MALNSATEKDSFAEKGLQVAAKWLKEADAVLICAGAGMSLNEGFNVYVNPADFKKHYPWFPSQGYSTAYECMGLFGDERVPIEAKWGFWARHMDNMRWAFPPPAQYATLLEMVRDKDYFVYTSNVDGCFLRAGFAADKIYTPQGDWAYYQCMDGCTPDSVFESRPMLDQVLSSISEEGLAQESVVPRCPSCGRAVFGNVRAGSSFIHKMYDDANQQFVQWVDSRIASKQKLVVIEIGAGFNTPTVTRFPMEAIVRELSNIDASLIRLNPSDSAVPTDLPRALGLTGGCGALPQIQALMHEAGEKDFDLAEQHVLANGQSQTVQRASRFSNEQFNWRAMMQNLRS